MVHGRKIINMILTAFIYLRMELTQSKTAYSPDNIELTQTSLHISGT